VTSRSDTRSGRRFTVVLALLANLGVGLAKLVAGLVTGSGALLSEAAHSAGDSATEVLLLVALRRSGRPADRTHPFGYGKERFFWSLMAAVAIFVSGAAFSIFEGVRTLTGGTHPISRLWVNYIVLGVAAVLEGVSLRNAARQVRSQRRRRRRSIAQVVLEPEDPTVNSVVLEDFTAIVGVGVAAIGVALHQITGSAVWDGAASLVIGVLLLVVALVLTRTCEELLIGKQADAALLRDIERVLESHREIDDVVDLLTMVTGVSRVLVCVRADFDDNLTGGEIEGICVALGAELVERHAEVDEVFIQPTSRHDRRVRERVRARYGRVLADQG
jgi:cation diffusion facilitator family transporter